MIMTSKVKPENGFAYGSPESLRLPSEMSRRCGVMIAATVAVAGMAGFGYWAWTMFMI
jgi:hypothetical protein